MMFESKASVKAWKALIGSVVNLQDELSFDIKPDMILSKNTMVGNVVLSFCQWKKEMFEEYKVEEEIRIGIRMDGIRDILKRFIDKDTLEVNYDNGIMYFKSGRKSFEMRCVSPSEPYPKDIVLKDEIQYAVFDTTNEELKDIMEDLTFLGEGCYIKSHEGKVIFSVIGDSGKGAVELDKPVSVVAETTMSIEFVNEILASLGKFSDSIRCHFFTNGYLMLRFFVKELGQIDYFIAPRIERKD